MGPLVARSAWCLKTGSPLQQRTGRQDGSSSKQQAASSKQQEALGGATQVREEALVPYSQPREGACSSVWVDIGQTSIAVCVLPSTGASPDARCRSIVRRPPVALEPHQSCVLEQTSIEIRRPHGARPALPAQAVQPAIRLLTQVTDGCGRREALGFEKRRRRRLLAHLRAVGGTPTAQPAVPETWSAVGSAAYLRPGRQPRIHNLHTRRRRHAAEGLAAGGRQIETLLEATQPRLGREPSASPVVSKVRHAVPAPVLAAETLTLQTVSPGSSPQASRPGQQQSELRRLLSGGGLDEAKPPSARCCTAVRHVQTTP
ncbi:hypothetical protein K505DRAFT_340646 [Melanomma pulvis-pyrius CBS 109.77]|uniref:Uncharacterized protein n=1 Tax=Melanomma pulvis-pyrius CBS 109.77 TaxID=1314802 RepID=A0A6A6X1W9_9PLEO|nr:hypothetical protein K505DRAFT_340646 [Melanomma pulvis-pyrius CBS 109.77]